MHATTANTSDIARAAATTTNTTSITTTTSTATTTKAEDINGKFSRGGESEVKTM